MTFIVPPPIATLDLTMSDGAAIRVRRHGNVEGPRIVLSHGNGFATDAYYPFWRYLLPDFDVIIFDQRNHGQNPFHPSGHTQTQMADDMETILRAVETKFGKRTTIGAFHSLSATVSLLHAARFGYRWDALILFDPPLAPPAGHEPEAQEEPHRLQVDGRARHQLAGLEGVEPERQPEQVAVEVLPHVALDVECLAAGDVRRPYMSTAFATPTARIAATIQARKRVPRCASIPSIATEVSTTMPIAAACESTGEKVG